MLVHRIKINFINKPCLITKPTKLNHDLAFYKIDSSKTRSIKSIIKVMFCRNFDLIFHMLDVEIENLCLLGQTSQGSSECIKLTRKLFLISWQKERFFSIWVLLKTNIALWWEQKKFSVPFVVLGLLRYVK